MAITTVPLLKKQLVDPMVLYLVLVMLLLHTLAYKHNHFQLKHNLDQLTLLVLKELQETDMEHRSVYIHHVQHHIQMI